MNIVEFDAGKHYKTMCSFWKQYGWIPCPLKALPKNGLVAETEQGEFISYMGAYIEPGTIAVIDWALSNPDLPAEESQKALKTIFSGLVSLAKSKDCQFIYSFTKNRFWGSRLQSYGMMAAERGTTTYIMPLGENNDVSFISD